MTSAILTSAIVGYEEWRRTPIDPELSLGRGNSAAQSGQWVKPLAVLPAAAQFWSDLLVLNFEESGRTRVEQKFGKHPSLCFAIEHKYQPQGPPFQADKVDVLQ